MLLVNWKESKNSDRKSPYRTWVWGVFSTCFFINFEAVAQPQTLSNPTSIVSIFLSLLLVVGVVFMLAFLMRRFNVTQGGSTNLKIVASMMAGTKERVMVIEVGGEQHLLGVTAHNINHLATLANPIETAANHSGENFKDKLALFMAGKANPAMTVDGASDATRGTKS